MLADIREKLNKRLTELQPMIDEHTEIVNVLDTLSNGRAAGKKRSTSATAPRTRAGRGERPEQFLALVGEKPGITIAQAAKEIGASPNYLHRLGRDMVADGKLVKQGSGYHSVAQSVPEEKPEEAPEEEMPEAA